LCPVGVYGAADFEPVIFLICPGGRVCPFAAFRASLAVVEQDDNPPSSVAAASAAIKNRCPLVFMIGNFPYIHAKSMPGPKAV